MSLVCCFINNTRMFTYVIKTNPCAPSLTLHILLLAFWWFYHIFQFNLYPWCFSTYELFLICGVERILLPLRLCSFLKFSKEEAILSWKQHSHAWSAFEKAEGTLTMVNNGMENAPLQSAGAVLIWGPSLQVEEQLLYVEMWPETQCGGDRFGWAWWGLSIHGHRCGQPVQVPMPQRSCADSCTPFTASHLLLYPVKLRLSQRFCAS